MAADDLPTARLSKMYGQLFSEEDNGLNVEEMVQLLLAVPSLKRDDALLQLSTLRRLFSNFAPLQSPTMPPPHSTPHSISAVSTSPGYSAENLCERVQSALIKSSGLVPNLVSQFGQSEDQFVLFCTSKALRAVLLSQGITLQEEWISMLLSGGSPATSLAVLYRFQTVTETLKTIRKNLVVDTDRTQHHSLQGKREVIFGALRSSWYSTLEAFKCSMCSTGISSCNKQKVSLDEFRRSATSAHCLDEGCAGTKSTRMFWQSFDEFLALTIEALRHQDNKTSSPMQWLYDDITMHVNDIGEYLLQSPSFFTLKRFFDMLIKLIDSPHLTCEIVERLSASLPLILSSTSINKVLHTWMSTIGGEILYKALMGGSGSVDASLSDSPGDPVEGVSLVKTIVRKGSLFLLKLIAVVTKHQDHGSTCCGASSQGYLHSLLDISYSVLADCTAQTGLSGSRGEMIHAAQTLLLDVLSEQDDCLVDALEACCCISKYHSDSLAASFDSLLSTLLHVVDVHSLFVNFLSNIGYDHSLILDFLISPETNFRAFLTDYLQLATHKWDDLLIACKRRDHFSPMYHCQDVEQGPVTLQDSTVSQTLLVDRHRVLSSSESLETPVEKDAASSSKQATLSLADNDESSSDGLENSPPPKRLRLYQHAGPQLPRAASPVREDESTFTPCEKLDDASDDNGSLSGAEEGSLERVMDCLTRLRFRLGRPVMQSLSPCPNDRLLELLDNLAECYERCSDER